MNAQSTAATPYTPRGLDFASNDYLGLANSQILRETGSKALDRGLPLGPGESRLLRGNLPEHLMLEAEAADFFAKQAALFLGGGFQANQVIFQALPAQGDLVLHDALIHASAHEGMRLGRADIRSFAHNDVDAARAALEEWRSAGGVGQVWVAVESLYSMEGDMAPLSDLAAFAVSVDAVLVVDEAHATGVFGEYGRGLAHELEGEILTLHTCGRGLGVSGGLILRVEGRDRCARRSRLPVHLHHGPVPFRGRNGARITAGAQE